MGPALDSRRFGRASIEQRFQVVGVVARQVLRLDEDEIEALPRRCDHVKDATAVERIQLHWASEIEKSRRGGDFVRLSILTKHQHVDVAEVVAGIPSEAPGKPRCEDTRVPSQRFGDRTDQVLLRVRRHFRKT